jgi:hypothetical protein
MGIAVTAHELVPDQFDWLSGRVYYPMEPQPIIAPGPLDGWPWYIEETDHDRFTSTVTVYGGRIANSEGNFRYGHVSAHIREPTPTGVKHQSNWIDPPVPYIARILTIKDDLVTVRTPEKDQPVGEGPVVFEGMDGHGRWATVTSYDPRSEALTVRSGDYITDGHSWFAADDRTIVENALALPQEIVDSRIATMVKTLDSATDILEQIADHQAEWNVSTLEQVPYT